MIMVQYHGAVHPETSGRIQLAAEQIALGCIGIRVLLCSMSGYLSDYRIAIIALVPYRNKKIRETSSCMNKSTAPCYKCDMLGNVHGTSRFGMDEDGSRVDTPSVAKIAMCTKRREQSVKM